MYHFNGQPVKTGDMDLINSALAIYGHDGNGIWTGENIGLGNRLSHYTPEDPFELQPLFSLDGRLVLVSDARIDNRPELARKLDFSPAEAEQLPDSAFILAAYEKWGEDCACYLIGVFAFALWNARKRQLLLARSPMGERSLYYHCNSRSFVFATRPKGLFALNFVPRELDRERIADFLVSAPSEPSKTFYRDIHRLAAGHCLVVQSDGVRIRQYWHLNLKHELRLPNDDDYVDAFNELFERVISDNLRSLSPVGVMMSGGLDSTSVAAIAARLMKSRGNRLATFTEVPHPGFDGAVMNGRYADETPFVQAMSRMYDNIDPNLICNDGRFYLHDIESFFNASEIPFRNASNRGWWERILCEARQRNVKVLLTGAMGNLTVSWSGIGLLPQLVSAGKWQRAWKESHAYMHQMCASSSLRVLVSQGIMPLLPTSLWRTVQCVRHNVNPLSLFKRPWKEYSPIRHEFADEQKARERALQKGFDFSFRSKKNIRKLRYESFMEMDGGSDYLSCYQAMFGVDTRDPTGDVRVFEFCLSLPEEQYFRDGKSRWLLKRSMAGHLPDEVLNNKLRGLQSSYWFENLRDACAEVRQEMSLLEKSAMARSVLDLKRMRRLVERMLQTGNKSEKLFKDYRCVLERGLMTGRFLRWFDSGE